MIITLTGKPGSGKSTVARIVAKELGYKFFSAGDLRGQIAMKHGLTIDQLNEVGKKEIWTDKECDDLLEKMGKTEDNIVFDSWLAWNFIPNSVKIFLDVDLHEAARRIFANQRPDEAHKDSVEEVFEMISKRLNETAARYKKWYNVDFLNLKNYDHIIDTTNLTPDKIAKKIIDLMKGKVLKSK
ncbi:cytidylate kinase family protein [Candidatus Woesearchaeota archaeon]|nr:cytidylate kinase family protein [Candidatus Woesearchaeota archaeon]